MMQLTYGLEEEAFILEPVVPSLGSLHYLTRLLWEDPREHYSLTAANLCHLSDLPAGIMGGVEVATRVHRDATSLLEDLESRRALLRKHCPALIVPMGHLLTGATRSRTCGLHMHVGTDCDPRRIYRAIAHFLPLLLLVTASSPLGGRGYSGKSYRAEHCFAIGPLGPDWTRRFQDIIYSRRLGTVEVRVCDAVWDMERIGHLVRAVEAIVRSGCDFPLDRDRYNRMRLAAARQGYSGEMVSLYHGLRELYELPEGLLEYTAADRVRELREARGLLAAYSAVDQAYRGGEFRAREVRPQGFKAFRAAAGVFGYLLPKAPYNLWKLLRES